MRMKRFREFFETLADIARMAAPRDPFIEAMQRDTMASFAAQKRLVESRLQVLEHEGGVTLHSIFSAPCPSPYAGRPIVSHTWPSRTIQLDVPGVMTTDHLDVRAQRSVEGRS